MGSAAGFPFGYPRIDGCMRLPGAYRSLPRPSTALKPSHPPSGVACRVYSEAQRLLDVACLCAAIIVDERDIYYALHPQPTLVGSCINRRGLGSTSPPTDFLGGDPAAGSPTATLLRLLPPRGAWIRRSQRDHASSKPHSGGATGGVCKEQGRIHRALMTRDY